MKYEELKELFKDLPFKLTDQQIDNWVGDYPISETSTSLRKLWSECSGGVDLDLFRLRKHNIDSLLSAMLTKFYKNKAYDQAEHIKSIESFLSDFERIMIVSIMQGEIIRQNERERLNMAIKLKEYKTKFEKQIEKL